MRTRHRLPAIVKVASLSTSAFALAAALGLPVATFWVLSSGPALAADGGGGAGGLGVGGTGGVPPGGAGGNGSTDTSGFSGGGGGGAGGAVGAAGGKGGDSGGGTTGGTAGTAGGGPGGPGNSTAFRVGGGGGGGGGGGANNAPGVGSFTNSAPLLGQSGGAGGNGGNSPVEQGTTGGGGGGGGGGAGGSAALVVAPGTSSNTSTITGGNGGAGGDGGNSGSGLGNGGNGGTGGAGVIFTGTSATFNNTGGTVTGGNGGAAGGGGFGGTQGAGGDGVVGTSLTINNTANGSISGGTGLTNGNALTLSGTSFYNGAGGSLTGNIAVAGSLTFNQATAVILPNLITDNGSAGSITQNGAGTLTLTNANTYSGGTTINSGTLSIAADNNLGASTGGLKFGGGTLQFTNGFTDSRTITLNTGGGTIDTQTNTVTLSGAIGGNGGLTKAGTGTLILSNTNNNYSGATFLTGGTIQVQANTALGTNALMMSTLTTLQSGAAGLNVGNTVALSGASTVDTQANFFTLSGGIGGTGTLNKAGTGTLILTDASNNYSGGTVLTNGTIQVQASSALGTFTLAMAAGTTLQSGAAGLNVGNTVILNGTNTVDTQANTFTLSGGIGGTGGLTQIGTGVLILTGIDNYAGATTVNGGTLVVNGSLTGTSGVTVNAGSTLTGTGTIDPPAAVTIASGATFAPGNAATPGSMSITGNLVLQSGALYLVQVTPAAASSSIVSGTATLGGTVQAVFAPGSYVGKQYTILQSVGLGGTTFSGLSTTGVPTGFGASLSYSTDDVFLNLTATLGAGAPLNGNQQNVSGAINTFFNNGGTLPPSFLTLFGLSGQALGNALSQLDGEAATDAKNGVFAMTTQFLGLMLDPYAEGRLGMGGAMSSGAMSGGAMGFAPERDASLPPDVALAYASLLKAPPYKAPPVIAQPWTVWGASFGGTNKTDGDPVVGSTDVTARDFGFAGGADYHVSPDTALGFALAGGGTNWGLAQGLGGGRSDAFQAGIYGKRYYGPAYVAAALTFAEHWMQTDRFAFAGDELTASFNAQSYGVRLESGYRYAVAPAFGVTPYAALQTQWFHTPGYSEADPSGGGFGLTYNSMTANDTRSELGARFDEGSMLGAMPLILRGRVAWAHDSVSNPALTTVFQTLPGASFIVNGAAPPTDSALASAGAELHLNRNWTATAKFDGEFASRAQTYAGTGTLRYSW